MTVFVFAFYLYFTGGVVVERASSIVRLQIAMGHWSKYQFSPKTPDQDKRKKNEINMYGKCILHIVCIESLFIFKTAENKNKNPTYRSYKRQINPFIILGLFCVKWVSICMCLCLCLCKGLWNSCINFLAHRKPNASDNDLFNGSCVRAEENKPLMFLLRWCCYYCYHCCCILTTAIIRGCKTYIFRLAWITFRLSNSQDQTPILSLSFMSDLLLKGQDCKNQMCYSVVAHIMRCLFSPKPALLCQIQFMPRIVFSFHSPISMIYSTDLHFFLVRSI